MTPFKTAIAVIAAYTQERVLTITLAFMGLVISALVVAGTGNQTSALVVASFASIFTLAASFLLIGTALRRQGLISFDVGYSSDTSIIASLMHLAIGCLFYIAMADTMALLAEITFWPSLGFGPSALAAMSIVTVIMLEQSMRFAGRTHVYSKKRA